MKRDAGGYHVLAFWGIWCAGLCERRVGRQGDTNVHSVREMTDRLIGAMVLTRRGARRLAEGDGAGRLWQSTEHA
jgi:hypothetical protein